MAGIETVLNHFTGKIPVEIAFEGLNACVVNAAIATAIILRKYPIQTCHKNCYAAFDMREFSSWSITLCAMRDTSGTVTEFPICL